MRCGNVGLTVVYCKWCAGSGEFPPGSDTECGTCHGEGEIVGPPSVDSEPTAAAHNEQGAP